MVDGTIGVLLGLYICSHPAANGIDLIFLERGAFRRATSRWSGVSWLALNGVVMFVGWLVIVAGASGVFGREVTRVPGARCRVLSAGCRARCQVGGAVLGVGC